MSCCQKAFETKVFHHLKSFLKDKKALWSFMTIGVKVFLKAYSSILNGII